VLIVVTSAEARAAPARLRGRWFKVAERCSIETRTVARAYEMTVTGEIDIACAGDVAALGMLGAVGTGIDAVVINMAGVAFIDAAGLGALVRIRNIALEFNKEFLLQDTPRGVRRLLRVTGLDWAFIPNGIANGFVDGARQEWIRAVR
jgi:anti-sigma B factor antagonist